MKEDDRYLLINIPTKVKTVADKDKVLKWWRFLHTIKNYEKEVKKNG